MGNLTNVIEYQHNSEALFTSFQSSSIYFQEILIH